MIQFSKIYRFLCRKIRRNQRQDGQVHTTVQKQNPPTKPPTKRVLITYGIFSSVFIVLATGAWFFKGAEFLPTYSLLTTNNTSNTNIDLKTKHDDKKNMAQKEYQNNKPLVNNLTDLTKIGELQNKINNVKDEIRQLNTELDDIRIGQYLASARYLIDTRTNLEQALSLLQSAHTHVKSHLAPSANTNALSQNIEHQITQLQQYIAHSPRQALTLLSPLIDRLHTKLEATPKPPKQKNTSIIQTDKSWIKEWLNKIYAAGKTLIKIEHPHYQYMENERLLLKLLVVARSAVLLNEQEQFHIALQDALRLIDTMPESPVSKEQIESILSLEITWQLPQIRQ